MHECLIAFRTVFWAVCLAAALPTPVLAQVSNVTGQYVVSRSGFTFDRASGTFDMIVQITAPGGAVPVGPPLTLVITSFSAPGVSLANGSGTTPDGKPKIDLPLPGPTFSAGQSLRVLLKFGNPQRARFTFAYRIDAVNSDIGVPVNFTLPTQSFPLAWLPINPATGLPILISMGDVAFEIDTSKRDRGTAMATCLDWVTSCLDPSSRTLDDCARSAPVCKTLTPWQESVACCPAACFGQYRAQRAQGLIARSAFNKVYLLDQTCMP